VASLASLRCTGASEVLRRSFGCGQRDPGEVDLRRSGAQVKMEPCQGEVLGRDREEGAQGDQEGVEAHQKPAMPSGSNGGAVTSGLGSLAAI
jgi:hypothetical protein